MTTISLFLIDHWIILFSIVELLILRECARLRWPAAVLAASVDTHPVLRLFRRASRQIGSRSYPHTRHPERRPGVQTLHPSGGRTRSFYPRYPIPTLSEREARSSYRPR